MLTYLALYLKVRNHQAVQSHLGHLPGGYLSLRGFHAVRLEFPHPRAVLLRQEAREGPRGDRGTPEFQDYQDIG